MESSVKKEPSPESSTTEVEHIVNDLVTIKMEPLQFDDDSPSENDKTFSINPHPVKIEILNVQATATDEQTESKEDYTADTTEIKTMTDKKTPQCQKEISHDLNRHTRHINDDHKKYYTQKSDDRNYQIYINKPNSCDCDICQKKYSHETEVITHRKMHAGKQIHMGENIFTCNVCKEQVCDKISLIKHLNVHTGEIASSVCGQQFTKQSTLKKHNVHTHKKKYMCEICNKQYTKSSTLVRHKFTHSAEKPYTCEICDKKFTQKSNLNRHAQNHTNRRPYGCTMCEKKFTQMCNLKHHELTHTRKNNYVCGVCNKDFPFASHLERHERCHTKEKPFECKLCKRHFTEAFNLRRHERLHLEGKLQGQRGTKKKPTSVKELVTVDIEPI